MNGTPTQFISSAPLKDKLTPPYVSWVSFRNYIDTLGENGVPQRVDGSAMSRLSGQLQTQVRGALRFFELVGDHDYAQESLRQLVRSTGEERKRLLAQLLNNSYGFLLGNEAGNFDIAFASQRQFDEQFKEASGLTGDTIRKAQAFFLNAAKEASIPLSNHIKPTPRVGTPTNPRTRPPAKGSAGTANTNKAAVPPAAASATPPDGYAPAIQIAPQVDSSAQMSAQEKMLEWILQIIEAHIAKLPSFNPEWSAVAVEKWLFAWEQATERLMNVTEEIQKAKRKNGPGDA